MQKHAEDGSSKFLRNAVKFYATRIHGMPHKQCRSEFTVLQMDLNLSVS